MRTTYRTNIIPLIPETAMPLVRTAYYLSIGTAAKAAARVRPAGSAAADKPVFIIGCGRSGTTLLGEILALHPKVKYIYEPYNLWAAIDPVTDFLGLYTRGERHCMLDAEFASRAARTRFRRLMTPPRGKTLVEKSPVNALRLGFLEAIAPGARFIHMVRDGVAVAGSVEKMASVTRPMAFRPPLNDWWGVAGAKWAALGHDGAAAGYYPDEVPHLATDAQRGAYEWLVSLREIDSWRERLGARLIDVRLEDLGADPTGTLRSVIDRLGAPAQDEEWLNRASQLVRPAGGGRRETLPLPDQMAKEFNEYQERYGFTGRAVSRGIAAPLS